MDTEIIVEIIKLIKESDYKSTITILSLRISPKFWENIQKFFQFHNKLGVPVEEQKNLSKKKIKREPIYIMPVPVNTS
jgi:hypothetical protein